ncbi:MAG: hypothetical protein NTW01_09350 [Gammaproteobacteria bacterium]|jgi:hypothetical protein|uniref:hypothetical protein n=1 Tax=Nevskia sp. TaxID=1929292 RepID=UPI003F71546F|nr:hypothetical protein [Gammaproteobacteria bacterium]
MNAVPKSVSAPDTTVALAIVEERTKNYRHARDLLASRLRQLEDEMDAAKRRAMPLITSALGAAKAAEGELSAAIQERPELFVKPRTLIVHAIKIGIEKQKGKIIVDDADRTVELIRKYLPDQFDALVKTRHKLVKAGLNQLKAQELKRIGAEATDAGDVVVIRPVDSDLEKLLNAFLKTDETSVEEDA